MIKVIVRDRYINIIPLWPITSGSVGLPVTFDFDETWDGLTRIAVFSGSGEEVEVALITDACVVPAEVLTTPGGNLMLGVYGRDAYGKTVIPTIIGKAGFIYDGTQPEEPDPSDPTPEWSYQVQQAATEAVRTAIRAEDKADQVLEETAEAREAMEQSEENAAASAQAAATSAAAAAESTSTANSSAIAAAGSATAAGNAQAAAENAQDRAETAMDAAEGSATAAAGSATAAGTAKTAAEAAQAAAEAARAGADSAAAQAVAAKADAQASAESAEDDAFSASQSAGYANTAKYDAEAAQAAAEAAKTAAQGSAAAASDSAADADTAKTAAEAAQAAAEAVAASIPEDYTDLSNDVSDLKSAIGYKLVDVVDATQYVSSNNAVTYNGDGTYTIGTSDYGTTTFNKGNYLYLGSGEYELFGVSDGNAFIAPSNSFSAAIFSNSSAEPKRIIITEEQAGYLYVGFYIRPKPTSAFVITPYLRKIESAVSDNKQGIDDLNRLTERTYNLASFDEQAYRQYGVLMKTHTDGTVELNGTATASNRSNYLKIIQLLAGNYRLFTQSDNMIVNMTAYNADNNAFISSGVFTLTETTNVGLAFGFETNRIYDEKLLVSLVKSDAYVKPIKAVTAIDELARARLDAIEAVKDAPYDMTNFLSINTKNGRAWSQGACTVGDKFVGFNASADDHATTANYFVCNVFDFSTKQTYSHNLGHSASADYNVKMDTMMVGNGAVSEDVLPTMYLVSNMQNVIAQGSDILINSPNVTSIDLTTIGGYEFVCCFGESECIAYAITQTATGKNFFKLLLGMGTNNMLTLYPQDSYGSFISGKADTEYNGTAHVLKKITATNVTGELQGLKFINGKIIMPTDEYVNNILTAFISVLNMHDDSILIEKNLWIPVLNTLGQPIRTECEDVTFHNGTGYVATKSEVGGSNIFATHQFNF